MFCVRFCARRDRILFQALEGDFTGFIFESETKQALEPEMDTTNTEPQSKSMKVESQSKFESGITVKIWLFVQQKCVDICFEATFDSLVEDGQNIISNL